MAEGDAGSKQCPRPGPRRNRLSPEHLEAWRRFHAKYPGYGRRSELMAAYARASGGLTLRFLKLNHGPALDEPELWSVEACAEELGVPASQLEAIMRQVGTWVEPQVRSDPEWRALKRSALQVGAEVVGREHAAEFAKPRGFSHTEFSDEVRDAVFHSVRVAQRNGAREVLLAHLCQASYEVATTTAECSPAPSIPFSTEAVNAVARAMELGRDDGDVVELRHLRAACGC